MVEAHAELPVEPAKHHLVAAVHIDGLLNLLPRPFDAPRCADGLPHTIDALAEGAPQADEDTIAWCFADYLLSQDLAEEVVE